MNAGSPKTGSGDSDADGIDDVCDPMASLPGDTDEDNDGTTNRQDNCPLTPAAVSKPRPRPRKRQISGPTPTSSATPAIRALVSVTQNGRTFNITLSSTVANGRYHVKVNNVPKCYGATPAGGTDADGDGYCSTQELGNDSGGCATYAYPNNQPFPGTIDSCPVRHTGWNAAYGSALISGIDSDGDTWEDAQETYLGTDPTRACQQNPEFPATMGGMNNETPLDNWPMDYNDDGVANTADVGVLVPRLNRPVNMVGSGGQPPTTRHDLDQDGIIATVDVGKFVAVLNKRCDSPTPNGLGYPTYSSQTQ